MELWYNELNSDAASGKGRQNGEEEMFHIGGVLQELKNLLPGIETIIDAEIFAAKSVADFSASFAWRKKRNGGSLPLAEHGEAF